MVIDFILGDIIKADAWWLFIKNKYKCQFKFGKNIENFSKSKFFLKYSKNVVEGILNSDQLKNGTIISYFNS